MNYIGIWLYSYIRSGRDWLHHLFRHGFPPLASSLIPAPCQAMRHSTSVPVMYAASDLWPNAGMIVPGL
jgi:hypothetical protein